MSSTSNGTISSWLPAEVIENAKLEKLFDTVVPLFLSEYDFLKKIYVLN